MNITKDVISDLLPLYYSEECSNDTKSFVEEYLRAHPDFATQAKAAAKNLFSVPIPDRLTENSEMKALKRTKWLLRLRTFFLAFAILFTLDPFSFSYSEGTITWLITQSPVTALIYGLFAIAFWAAYIVVRRKTKDV